MSNTSSFARQVAAPCSSVFSRGSATLRCRSWTLFDTECLVAVRPRTSALAPWSGIAPWRWEGAVQTRRPCRPRREYRTEGQGRWRQWRKLFLAGGCSIGRTQRDVRGLGWQGCRSEETLTCTRVCQRKQFLTDTDHDCASTEGRSSYIQQDKWSNC